MSNVLPDYDMSNVLPDYDMSTVLPDYDTSNVVVFHEKQRTLTQLVLIGSKLKKNCTVLAPQSDPLKFNIYSS
jgi:hypothetical protein